VPPVPTGLTATANSSSQITVTWTAVSTATGYDLQVDGATVSNAVSPYVHSGLAALSTHSYAVRAKNSAGTSSWSGLVSATTLATTTLPNVPTGLTAAAGNAQVTLSWMASAGATSYNVYRSTTPGGEGTTASATGIASTSYTNTGLTNGTTYYYKVAAVNAVGTSAQSSEISATPTGGRSPYGGTNWPIANGTTIQAENYDLGGEGVAYHDTTVANQGGQFRTDGVDIEATTDTSGGYNVGWIDDGEWLDYTVNTTAGTYNIVVRGASNNNPNGGSVNVLLDGVVLGTVAIPYTGGWQTWQDFTISNVAIAAGTGRTLQLQFIGGGFNVNYVRFSTSGSTVPAAPTGLAATVNSSSQITVSWNAVSTATGYDLLVDGATLVGVTSPYVHAGLVANSTHTYAVRAKNSAGASAWSGSVSATTTNATSGTLTLGQVANPNGHYFSGYYPTWSDNWFTVLNNDGTKKTDDAIYTASHLAQVPGVFTHVMLAFGQPDFSWSGIAANSWSGTGLNFTATPVDIKEAIRLLHSLKKKVILSVGGATYNSWTTLANEAGQSGAPTKTALTNFMIDLGVDGLDVDYEIDGADAANNAQYAKAIQAMREAVNAAGGGRILAVAGWSTGSDYTAATVNDPGYPGTVSYWGGSAGRERQVFKMTVSSGSLAGRTIASLLDIVNVMSYDAQTFHYDPVTAFDQYRALVPASTAVSLGLEVPPEGWAGGLLVINNSQAGPTGTVVVADQYGATPRGPYSVERFGNYVLQNTRTANPHDGLMLWQILATTSVPVGTGQSANATTIAAYVSTLFGYVPTSP